MYKTFSFFTANNRYSILKRQFDYFFFNMMMYKTNVNTWLSSQDESQHTRYRMALAKLSGFIFFVGFGFFPVFQKTKGTRNLIIVI